MPFPPLRGLIAATHTPLAADGSLHLAAVEKLAAHLIEQGVGAVFITGTTGEYCSLTVEERRQLAERWLEVARGAPLRVVVQVGSNCLADAAALAAHAGQLGAAAVAALAPSYFKPRSVETLVECCRAVAAAAGETPFYYYDIPALTGVILPMPEFMERVRPRLPNFAGLKYTNPDLPGYQLCLRRPGGADVLWGLDESLLAALAVGAEGAVGGSFGFAAPLYQRLWRCFDAGDMEAARREQLRSARLLQLLAKFGGLGAAKCVMGMVGIDVGPARLPHDNLSAEEIALLRRELEQLGFFDWLGT